MRDITNNASSIEQESLTDGSGRARRGDSAEEWTIRQMCDQFDVTPRALRFYEQQELLAPRREGLRRLYSRRDRARLTLILRGKRFGFSLAELREHLDLYDREGGVTLQLQRTLETGARKLGEFESQRAELDRTISALKAQMAEWERLLSGAATVAAKG